jgi:hypothetical protein
MIIEAREMGLNAVIRMFRGSRPQQWGAGGRPEFTELPGNDAPAEFYAAYDRINAEVFNNELERIHIRVNTGKFNSGFVSHYHDAGIGLEFIGFWETFPKEPEYMFEQMARHMAYVTQRKPSPEAVAAVEAAPSGNGVWSWLSEPLFPPAPHPAAVSVVETAPAKSGLLQWVSEPVSVASVEAPFVFMEEAVTPPVAAPISARAPAPSVRWREELEQSALLPPPVAAPQVEALLSTALQALNARQRSASRRSAPATPATPAAAPAGRSMEAMLMALVGALAANQKPPAGHPMANVIDVTATPVTAAALLPPPVAEPVFDFARPVRAKTSPGSPGRV